MNKLRVGVLMGGISIEREVSFNSGRTVCDHLDTRVYDIVPLFQHADGTLFKLPWNFLCRGKITDFAARLATQAERISWDGIPTIIDFMYIATHGRGAEDGSLQGMLEMLRIPYLGPKVFASAASMQKYFQKQLLRTANINVAADVFLRIPDIAALTPATISPLVEKMQQSGITFPCVVKPNEEGSSLGVSIVKDADALYNAIIHASTIHPGIAQAVLIEEKISGMEFSCIIITDAQTGKLVHLPPTEIVLEAGSEFFDYEQKYMPGRGLKFTPARCSTQARALIEQTCTTAMNTLGLTTLARVDGFLTSDERVIILEVNPISGMGPTSFLFHQAAELDMSHAHIINHLIATELRYYSLRK